VLPAAPDGYVDNGVTPHKVIGSPVDMSFVRLERLSGPGGVVVRGRRRRIARPRAGAAHA
jgi:hypothetical protein